MIKAHIYGYPEAMAGKTNVHTWLPAVPKAGDPYFDAEGEFQILAVGYEAGKEHIRVFIKKDLPQPPQPTPEEIERQRVWEEEAAKQQAEADAKAKKKWYQFWKVGKK